MQNAILVAIDSPDFDFDLPELNEASWEPLLRPQVDERERLEFVGDGLMHAAVGIELNTLFPQGTPHLFTVRGNNSS